jgi:hypothetical protein
MHLVGEAGFEIVAERPSGPSVEGLEELQSLPIAPRFRRYAPEELGVTILSFVATR